MMPVRIAWLSARNSDMGRMRPIVHLLRTEARTWCGRVPPWERLVEPPWGHWYDCGVCQSAVPRIYVPIGGWDERPLGGGPSSMEVRAATDRYLAEGGRIRVLPPSETPVRAMVEPALDWFDTADGGR